MDFDSLSKEELIRLLKERSLTTNSAPGLERKTCKFIPKKGELTPCLDVSTTAYGFCSKHKNTVQSRQAELLYAKEQMEKKIAESMQIQEQKLVENKVVPQNEEIEEKPKKKIISQNKWGRFEDLETGIVFDPTTKTAFGVQNRKTGGLMRLDDEKVLICQEKGWRYKLFDINKKPSKKKVSSPVESENDSEEEKIESEDEPIEEKVKQKTKTEKNEKSKTKSKKVEEEDSSEEEEEKVKQKTKSKKVDESSSEEEEEN
jgi:hypothetical protein